METLLFKNLLHSGIFTEAELLFSDEISRNSRKFQEMDTLFFRAFKYAHKCADGSGGEMTEPHVIKGPGMRKPA